LTISSKEQHKMKRYGVYDDAGCLLPIITAPITFLQPSKHDRLKE
jgi:hypothetical protein